MGLKKELKNDIWKLIDGEKIPEKRENKFKFLVLQLLLQSNGFNLGKAFEIADELEEKYNKILDEFYDYLKSSNGDLLMVLKNIDKEYTEIIEPLFKKVEKIGVGKTI